MFIGHCHCKCFRDSFCLASVFEMTVYLLTYLLVMQVIPKCSRCDASVDEAVVKPDIVFFGQSLPEEFHRQMQLDKDECDLLIVIGSSLKVQPVALIPSSYLLHVSATFPTVPHSYLQFHGHFSSWTRVSHYRNVSILDI